MFSPTLPSHPLLFITGANATLIDDAKHGHGFELTLQNMDKPKQYHFYTEGPEEATQWCQQINIASRGVLP
ncbi:unnamed protein product, partial [Didymodactylos carnosus]